MKTKFNIAVLYQTDFGSISPGGIQNYIYAIGKSAPMDFQITYIGVGPIAKSLPRSTDRYIEIPLPNWRLPLSFKFAFAMRKINLNQFSVVICHRVETLVFKKIWKKTAIVNFAHGGSFNYFRNRKGLFGLLLPILELLQLRRVALFYSVVPERMQYILRNSSKMQRAPRIIDTEVFFKDNVSKERHGIAIIGRLESEKRFDLALEIISKAKQKSPNNPRLAKIVVIGEGSLGSQLRDVASKLQLDVQFLGSKSGHEVARLLREEISTILITSKFEGFPLVALEAVSCGCICVALKAPGVTEAMDELQQKCFNTTNEIVDYLASSGDELHNLRNSPSYENEINSFYDQISELSKKTNNLKF